MMSPVKKPCMPVLLLVVLAAALILLPSPGSEPLKAAPKLIKELELFYDPAIIGLNTACSEEEVFYRVQKYISSTTTGVTVANDANSDFCYMTEMGWASVIGSGQMVTAGREYGIMFGVQSQDGYDFPAALKPYEYGSNGKLSDVSGFSVSVNGSKLADAQFFYSEPLTMLCLYVPLGTPSTAPLVPVVESVSIDTDIDAIEVGTSFSLSATVHGFFLSGADGVAWSLTGNQKSATQISSGGVLTVAPDETASSLTVRATAAADGTKYASKSIPVSGTPLTVEGVSIFTPMEYLYVGDSAHFTAEVTGHQPDKRLTWSVEGASAPGTGIDADGYLQIAANETASKITVRATSVYDSSKSDAATIQIRRTVLIQRVDISYDPDVIGLTAGTLASDIRQRIYQTIDCSTEGILLLRESNSGLAKESTYGWGPVTSVSEVAEPAENYAIFYGLQKKDGYEFPEALKSHVLEHPGDLKDLTGFSVYVNGQKLGSAFYYYSEPWNMITLYVPLGKPAAAPKPETPSEESQAPSGESTAAPENPSEPPAAYAAGTITPETPVVLSTLQSSIAALKNTTKNLKGTSYSILKAQGTALSNTRIRITWSKVPGAKKYIIYGNRYGKSYRFKKLATLKKSKTCWTKKGLSRGTYYKVFVVAVSGKKALAVSAPIHLATAGGTGKKGNPAGITLNKKSLSLRAGKKKSLKTTVKAGALAAASLRKVCFESDNLSVAKVSTKGKVTAVGKGTCYIYAYTQNGLAARTKVTVK